MCVSPRSRPATVARAVCVAAVLASCAWSAVAGAAPRPEEAGRSLVLPTGPARPGFELSRFHAVAYGTFETFEVRSTEPLRAALAAERVGEDTSLLVTDTGGVTLALLVEQMAYHHVAQGRTAGKPWLVSFCVVCNTARRLVPDVRGTVSRFETVGAYDGMLVIQDAATRSLWNHVTGEALYGPAVGSSLGPAGNVLQVSVKQALAMDPHTRIAISDRFYIAAGRVHGSAPGFAIEDGRMARAALERQPGSPGRGVSTNTAPHPGAALSGPFAATLGAEDPRRPRMDLGLGLWAGRTSRYYPMARIRERGGALIDEIDGRRVLVYIDPETFTPSALFVDSAQARLAGDTVHLDQGQRVRTGVLLDKHGERVSAERPQQVFTRWYGFALTFPGTGIFGDS